MCGIFGVLNGNLPEVGFKKHKQIVDTLFKLSETRGKEASGMTIMPDINGSNIHVIKSSYSGSELIKTSNYRNICKDIFNKDYAKNASAILGHTRLVTNGSHLEDDNNQPIVYDNIVIVHNGIIVNSDKLWQKHSDLKKGSSVDTEIMAALFVKYFKETNSSSEAVKKVFGEIYGTASIAITFTDLNIVILASNNGSLYTAQGEDKKEIYFASEKNILNLLLKKKIVDYHENFKVKQIASCEGVVLDLDSFKEYPFDLDDDHSVMGDLKRRESKEIKNHSIIKKAQYHTVFDVTRAVVPNELDRLFQKAQDKVATLTRCTKCIMPETVPFIHFDDKGVCNFCNNYKKIELRGEDKLIEKFDQFRRPGKETDCVVALSGGRDSCYGLHKIVKDYHMKPITYTYDWGVITDLARRNVSRICSKLGVENIIISADIAKKRSNIRKNVIAWLNKPHLGMVPLFMAGDKQFVSHASRIRKENDIDLEIFCFNLLEKTQFKEEFTGIQLWKPGADADKLGEELPLDSRIKLALFYAKEFLTNAGYLNTSLWDTFIGYVCYYYKPLVFVPMFHYLPWEENQVHNLLIGEYEWEMATDTKNSWRIGDGTAPFYNYIYYMTAGFTEYDTMRSNQIREGCFSREEGLQLSIRDNYPRWDTFKWYCDILNFDFVDMVKKINSIKKTNSKLI